MFISCLYESLTFFSLLLSPPPLSLSLLLPLPSPLLLALARYKENVQILLEKEQNLQKKLEEIHQRNYHLMEENKLLVVLFPPSPHPLSLPVPLSQCLED